MNGRMAGCVAMLLLLTGLAGESEFSRLAATLAQPATSFALLTDRAKLDRAPQRIVVRQIGKMTTLEAALQSYQVDSRLWPRVAWMNELLLSNRLQPGQRIKIIE